MKIHAVTDDALAMQAALATPEMRNIIPMLRAQGVTITGRIALRELDAKLAATALSTTQRIQVKSALSRAGLLV